MKFPSVLLFCVGVGGFVCPLNDVFAQRSFSAAPSTVNPFAQPQMAPQPTPMAAMAAPGGAYVVNAPMAISAEPIDPNHKLGRSDRLSYSVREDRDNMVWPLMVTDSGEIELPLGGRVKAAGKTTDQLQAEIKARLEREYYYHATVSLGLISVAAKADRGAIYVNGAVKNQGMIRLPADAQLTVSQAITQSGGAVDFSDLRHVVVLRKGAPNGKIVVDVAKVLKGRNDLDVVLETGDSINVGTKWLNY